MNNSIFPSALVNPAYVETMAKEAEANGYKAIVPEQCGYVLVATRLVPLTFIERIKAELSDTYFNYGCVLSESALFGDSFLQSLNDDERAVLMPSVLILIERGDLGVNLFESAEDAMVVA